jgi:hypothetical protein
MTDKEKIKALQSVLEAAMILCDEETEYLKLSNVYNYSARMLRILEDS